MVLMALDHTRWFFTKLTFQPEELARTDLWLFLTRWVTHFCAPGFFLLAGFGIYLYSSRTVDKPTVVRYLLSRGVMLILLELTVVGFALVFTPGYSFGGVIWALGWSFILMAGFIAVPRQMLLVGSAGFLLLHNLLDPVIIDAGGWKTFFWNTLYKAGTTTIPGITDSYYMLFAIVPWFAIMVFGYSIGHIFQKPVGEQQKFFLQLGWTFIVTFMVLRVANVYGNPETLFISNSTSGLFSIQEEFTKTVINFLNTEKYPPSLLFILMTLGPIFLWLGYTKIDHPGEQANRASRVFVLFGQVPLVYYICHLYLIHLFAVAIGVMASQPVDWLLFGTTASSRTEGFGFSLWVVWIMWIVTISSLYPICWWYARYKREHSYAWLKFL